jgi:copper resistance protein B
MNIGMPYRRTEDSLLLANLFANKITINDTYEFTYEFKYKVTYQLAIELTHIVALILLLLLAFGTIASAFSGVAAAQSTDPPPTGTATTPAHKMDPPAMDNQIFAHVLFDQFEDRTNGPDNAFRWDGQAWIGNDMNRLWLKTEGIVSNGEMSDGDQEVLYARPIPRVRYFDGQIGIREDLDSGPHRTWGAIGIEGLAPHFFQLAPTFYFRDGGHVAGKITGSYDLLITQRLVAQPEVEMNFYSHADPARGIGSGLSDLDAGLRLRYEFSRKFAPYIGLTYSAKLGDTASIAHQAGTASSELRFVFGLRFWF